MEYHFGLGVIRSRSRPNASDARKSLSCQVEMSSVAVGAPSYLHESNLAPRPTSSGFLVRGERASEERPRADNQEE